MQYPDVFFEPISAPYHPEMSADDRKRAALSDQLNAWGCAMAGEKPQKSFGEVMVKLRSISGAGTPEECMAAAEKIQPNT